MHSTMVMSIKSEAKNLIKSHITHPFDARYHFKFEGFAMLNIPQVYVHKTVGGYGSAKAADAIMCCWRARASVNGRPLINGRTRDFIYAISHL